MTWVIGGISFVCVLCTLCLFLIAPNRKNRTEELNPFREKYVAHRGLFNNASDAPENSAQAFRKAVAAGYGIELDVQMTTDGKLVVFHDESLKRMCGADKKLTECTYDELMQYRLADSEEKIPLFDDVLEIIDGKVPLVVEIKPEGDWRKTTRLTAERLDRYPGIYCVESFHPFVLCWLKKNRPAVLRGQLSTDFFRDGTGRKWYECILLGNLLVNCVSRPDFISYNHRFKNNLFYRICRTVFTVENAAWTIRSQEELEQAKDTFRIFIFDSFIPKV